MDQLGINRILCVLLEATLQQLTGMGWVFSISEILEELTHTGTNAAAEIL